MALETNFPLKTPERIAAIEAWWRAFSENEAKIAEIWDVGSDFDVVGFMAEYLQAISEELMWEFGPGLTKAHRLALSAEENRSIEPLVSLIISRAPPDLFYFDIVKSRPRTDWEQFKKAPDSRVTWKNPEGIQFISNPRAHNLIDVTFFTKPEHQDDRTFSNCFLMAEALLGEAVVETWIGFVDVVETKETKGLFSKKAKSLIPSDAKPIHTFRETVASQISDIKNKLPKKPLFELTETESWSLLKMEPEQKSDYKRMDDLYVMQAFSLGPYGSLYSGQNRFVSERFTAMDETFVFIKMDGSAADFEFEVFEDRSEIEDALNSALNASRLGGIIGGGTGYKYSYIFLAVTNLEAAIRSILDVLRAGKLTRRAWIMFNDYRREQEWIGVWDDTPAPLLPTYDD